MGLVGFVHKIELAIIFSNFTVKMLDFFPIGERANFAEYLLAINVSVSRQGMPIQTDRNERGVLLEDIFAEIRNAVPMQDIAKFYGLQISRSGMACCPFHDDKTPSMKIYFDHFYCFGCGESGDGTAFVAKLFHISQFEAAKKISYDFGLNLFNGSRCASFDGYLKLNSVGVKNSLYLPRQQLINRFSRANIFKNILKISRWIQPIRLCSFDNAVDNRRGLCTGRRIAKQPGILCIVHIIKMLINCRYGLLCK